MAECPDKKVPPPPLRDLVSLRISDWHKVGLELGFKKLDLMMIRRAHSGQRDEQHACQRTMFGKWLREHPSPHAHGIIYALRSAEEHRAADTLAQKYGEGMTPPVISQELKQRVSNINMVISGPEYSGKDAITNMIKDIAREGTTPDIALMTKNRSLLRQNLWTEYLAALNYQIPNLNAYPNVHLGELPEVIEMAPILFRGPSFHLICFDLMEDMDTPVEAAVSNDQLKSPLSYVSWKSVKQFIHQVVETVTTSWAHLTGQEPRKCRTTAIVGVHSEMRHQVVSELLEADAAVQQVVHTCGTSRSVRYCRYQDRMIFDLNIGQQNTRLKEELREVMRKPELKETIELDSPSYNLIIILYERGGVLRLSDCKELARLCGVRDEDLPALLKKVHDKLGLILFFPEVPKMKSLVLCHSDELINPMEYFIAVALNGTPEYPRDPSEVRKTGEIPRSLIDVVISHEGPGDKVTTSSLLQLLKYYKFLSDTESSDGTPSYFMPCLLQSHPSHSYQLDTYQHRSAAPLLFCFKHGHIPYGLFSALAAQLARVWRLDHGARYKDHLTFIADNSSLTKVELTDRGDHIRLVVTDNILSPEFYTRVRREVQRALYLVKVRYIHLSTERCDIGFYCPRSQHNPHCAVVQNGHLKCTAQRCQRGRVSLEKRMKIWFTGEQALDDTIMQGFSNLLADTSISSDQDEEDIMQQIEGHIDEEGCLQLRVVRCALFGAPGVGKTSSMKRLTEQIENLEGMSPLPSTGIERPITVPLFGTTKQLPVLIAESEWNPQDLDSQLQMILQCIITTDDGTPLPDLASPPSPATGQTKLFPVPTSGSSPSTVSSIAPTAVASDPQESASVTGPVAKTRRSSSTPPQPAPSKPPNIHFIRDLLKKKSWKKMRNLLKEFDDVTLLNIVDTGGQPEYQDILPVLLGGSGLSLLFHNLSQDLEQPYPVVYRHEEGRRSIEYRSQLTTLQLLFQVLSTITVTSSGEPPAAVLIGTHRDKVARNDLDSMEEKMHRAMEGTEFLKKDMIQTFEVEGKKRVVYPLDNMTGTKAEIKRLQKIISDITKRFQRKRIPTSWLLFHLAMRYLYEDPGFCTMKQCVQLAARCGINKEEVPHILSYFHNHFGTILHFPDVPCLKDIVICNPSIIFKAINSLVAESFATNPDAPHTALSIRETGEIPKNLLDRICSSQSTGVLPAPHIIELLQYHHLISEVYTSEAGQERRQTALFMPCLLQLCSVVETLEELHQQSIAPLFIHFSCGYIPMGLFPALIASLSKHWILDRRQRYKNKVKFITNSSSLARCQLTMQLKHIQVQAQHRGGVEELNQVCITIRQTLLSTITAMIEKFTYLKGITPQLQLLCPVSTESKEFATCIDKETPQKMLCSAACCSVDNTHDLLAKHRIWFSSFEPDGTEFTDIGETSPGGAATQVRKRKLTDEPPTTGGESPEHVRTKRSSAQAEDVMEVSAPSSSGNLTKSPKLLQPLTTNDLSELLDELKEVFPDWYILGVKLGLHISQLNEFEQNYKTCSRCMIAMLEAWLKKGSNPSRSQLAAALRAPAVGHNDVAARIESSDNC